MYIIIKKYPGSYIPEILERAKAEMPVFVGGYDTVWNSVERLEKRGWIRSELSKGGTRTKLTKRGKRNNRGRKCVRRLYPPR